MHSFLLNLVMSVVAKAEEIVLSQVGTAVTAFTDTLKLFGHHFEAELILTKKD